MLAPWVTTSRVPGPAHDATIALAPSVSARRRSRRTKALLNVGSISTGPVSKRRAVSRQRHQGELRSRPMTIPSALSRAPIARASARPLSLRLRWVAQSSSLKPGGSPAPPGASAWRMRATNPPRRRVDQASPSSAAASRGFIAISRQKARIVERGHIIDPPSSAERTLRDEEARFGTAILRPSRGSQIGQQIGSLDRVVDSAEFHGSLRNDPRGRRNEAVQQFLRPDGLVCCERPHRRRILEVFLRRDRAPNDPDETWALEPRLARHHRMARIAVLKHALTAPRIPGLRHCDIREQRQGKGGKARSHGLAPVRITTSLSAPDSGNQTSPGRPRIWRTSAPSCDFGIVVNRSDFGSKAWIACPPKSDTQTTSRSST